MPGHLIIFNSNDEIRLYADNTVHCICIDHGICNYYKSIYTHDNWDNNNLVDTYKPLSKEMAEIVQELIDILKETGQTFKISDYI